MIIRIVLVCLFLFGSLSAQTADNTPPAKVVPPAQAEGQTQPKIDPAKEADIRHLLKLVRVDALVTQIMDSMTNGIKPLMTNSLPPGEYRSKLIDLFLEKFRSKATPSELIDMAVPVYDKYFTDNEIKGLITFYGTPLGQKAISTLPQLTAEMQQNGRRWGENLGRQSMQEVLTEHPDLAEALNAAALNRKME